MPNKEPPNSPVNYPLDKHNPVNICMNRLHSKMQNLSYFQLINCLEASSRNKLVMLAYFNFKIKWISELSFFSSKLP